MEYNPVLYTYLCVKVFAQSSPYTKRSSFTHIYSHPENIYTAAQPAMGLLPEARNGLYGVS